ncbi:MAG: Ig-like domain-containing domain [Cyclobacteriaceae bacterium]
MRNVLLVIAFILLVDYMLPSCANPQAPTGGPKDTIPPTLLEAYPQIGTINFTGQEITLEFDEAVKADRLQTALIITPQQEVKFKTITRKNRLTLKFDQPFPDSTTITLNFLEGITDITEGNPAINLSYVFSTGLFLDSLSVSGRVFYLMTAKPADQTTVGLFTIHDSLNLQTSKPTYFIKTDKEGNFKIANIKNGNYRLLAFKDANNNLILDAKEEAFGFSSDTLILSEDISQIELPLIKQNISKLRLISSRPAAKYYELKYSKGLSTIESDPQYDHKFDPSTNSIRLYRPDSLAIGDSILTRFTVLDSSSNMSTDTVYVKFNESTRKPSSFEGNILPNDKKFLPNITYTVNLSKPVTQFDSSIILFRRDSTIQIPLPPSTQFDWNNNYTQLIFNHSFDTAAYYTSQKEQYDSIQLSRVDTARVIVDSTSLRKARAPKTFRKSPSVTLTFPRGTFISVENDTLDTIDKTVSFYNKKELGSIITNLTGFDPMDQVELVDKSFKVIRSYPYANQIHMTRLPPGEYGIRILIDSNKDGKWSPGNFLENIEPEEVYLFPDFTSLRANWEINLNISK